MRGAVFDKEKDKAREKEYKNKEKYKEKDKARAKKYYEQNKEKIKGMNMTVPTVNVKSWKNLIFWIIKKKMGNCRAKDVIDVVEASKRVISTIVDITRNGDDAHSYKCLLEMVMNLDKFDKHTQKVILSVIQDKLKN